MFRQALVGYERGAIVKNRVSTFKPDR